MYFMSVTAIIGAQWGDEGKGKIIDYLSQKANFVIRYHGGNNAGHTVINEYGKFPLHLIPSGIFSQKATACIANGTVLDLDVLVAEIAMLEKAGISLTNRLFISPRCHVIMPYHKLLDGLYEKAKGKNKTGTTGRGIGPVHADKVSYNGIRLLDVFDTAQFAEKLRVQLLVKNKIIRALGEKPLQQKTIETHYLTLFRQIKQYIREPYPLLQQAIKNNQSLLLEGAQGVFLDNDWGTYPFVTASTVLAGGSNATAGIPPQKITSVIGVVKAYTTRVGAGPFPTELFDKIGEQLRAEGAEFGTTTGRARRCGWFDAQLIRFAAEINGFTDLAITKLDVLDFLKEIKLCTGYLYRGKRVQYWDMDAVQLASVQPVYKTMPGWQVSTKGITSMRSLPKQARLYLQEIEKQVGCAISLVSTGPEREAIIDTNK